MKSCASIFAPATLVLCAALAAGCGGSGSTSVVGVGTITITGFSPNPVPGGVPTPFTITGVNFETTTGTTAIVTFRALGGATPFADGTSDVAEVAGSVLSDTTITGTTPSAQVCGVASIFFSVQVTIESGVQSNVFDAGGTLAFSAPTVTGVTASSIPAEIPTPIVVNGTGFGPVGGTAIVRFVADGGVTLFGDASLAETTVQGSITSSIAISVTPPLAAVCGAASRTASVQVILDFGSCTALAAGALTYDAPTIVSTSVPSTAWFQNQAFTLTGTGFGSVGAQVTLRFSATGALSLFSDGSATTFEAVGTVIDDTTITGTYPRVTRCVPVGAVAAGGTPASVTSVIRGIFPAGSCADSPAAFVTHRLPQLTTFSVPAGGLIPATNPTLIRISGTDLGVAASQIPIQVLFFSAGGFIYEPNNAGVGQTDNTHVVGTLFSGGTEVAVVSTRTAVIAADRAVGIRAEYEDGTCTNTILATWVAPPIITSFVNSRPPFEQTAPATLNANRALGALSTPVTINGLNFQAGATHLIFDTAVGPTQPIGGTGTLSGAVVAATTITGGSPIDLTLPTGLTQATIRVTNPDGQVSELTSPTVGAVFSTDDVLPNINASVLPGNNAEMNIAVNPTDNTNAVIFAHDLTTHLAFSDQMLAMHTTDAGVTWTAQPIGIAQDGGMPPFGVSPSAFRFDPVCGADAFGNFYLAYCVVDDASIFGPGISTEFVVLLQSSDGGATWGGATPLDFRVLPTGVRQLDRIEMGTGLALGGGAGDQAVYVAYKDFGGGPTSQILVNGMRATGPGAFAGTFGIATVHPTFAPAPGNDFMHPSCAVGPNGDLFVSFIERNGNSGSTGTYITRDPDGHAAGAFGFGSASLIATITAPNTRAAGAYPNPQINRGYGSTPAIEVVQAGPYVGRVVCAYDDKFLDDGFPGDEVSFGMRILTRFSDTSGTTWSGPTQAHVLDTNQQFMPWLGVDHTTGSIYVTWYDSRNDAANRAVERFSAVSADGSGWVNPLLLSQTPSNIDDGTDGNDYLEYCGVAAEGGCVYACWCDFTQAADGEVFSSVYQQNP